MRGHKGVHPLGEPGKRPFFLTSGCSSDPTSNKSMIVSAIASIGGRS
jgi:hypothetical protein